MKGLVNIKNNNNKCFLWWKIRHLNPLKVHPKRIKKAEKNMGNDLHYKSIELNKKNNVCINVFCYENNLVYPG